MPSPWGVTMIPAKAGAHHAPPMYVAAAAARTDRLASAGWDRQYELYDPLRVVEEVVALDNLTQGRLEVGLVSGACHAFHPLQGGFRRPTRPHDRGVSAPRPACASPNGFSFAGSFHDYADVALMMPPVQRPASTVSLPPPPPNARHPSPQEGIHSIRALRPTQSMRRISPPCPALEQGRPSNGPHQSSVLLIYIQQTNSKAWDARAG